MNSLKQSESCLVMSNSLRPSRLYSPWNSPGQNTGVGSRSLLQGIFPTQVLNPGFPLQADSLPAEPPGYPMNSLVTIYHIQSSHTVIDYIFHAVDFTPVSHTCDFVIGSMYLLISLNYFTHPLLLSGYHIIVLCIYDYFPLVMFFICFILQIIQRMRF